MAFRDVVNQDHAILLFRLAVRAGKVGHAYLLVGPSGVGRRTLALAFAQFLNCERPDGDACGECDPCRRIVSGNHPDVRILDVAHGKFFEVPEKDYRGKEIPIDQIRALRQDAAYPPYQGRRKVYIIADAERMNPNSSNSLLKILEEPPARITFILIAESAVALLPTIVSRCQLVRCTYLRADQIERALIERRQIDEARAGVLSALADGRLGRALEWADSEERLGARDRLLDLLPALEEGDLLVRLDAADALVKETQGKEGDLLPQLLDLAVLWYRDLLVWKQLQEPALLVNRDRQSQIARLAGEYGEALLGARIEAVEAAKESLRRNVNARLALEKLFLSFGPAPVAAP
ncbi:MAG: DNA polymerase III subunit delta' [bacterium]|nr:DNA polymerase III subunit delta' [bacterium]